MLRPYAAPASRQLTERRTGLLFTKRRLFLILPIFAVISFLAPANLQQHLRRLADKCIHNVYANPDNAFNLPKNPSNDDDVPTYISLCQEMVRREAYPDLAKRAFLKNENLGVCIDWTAPHYNMLDMISASIVSSVLPGVKYRHDCSLTRTWDEAVVGCDRTTTQQTLSSAAMPADLRVMDRPLILQQCKAVLMDWDPVIEKKRKKSLSFHHPFAWPELTSPIITPSANAGVVVNSVSSARRRLQGQHIEIVSSNEFTHRDLQTCDPFVPGTRPYRVRIVNGTDTGLDYLDTTADGNVALRKISQFDNQMWRIRETGVATGLYTFSVVGDTNKTIKMLSSYADGSDVSMERSDDNSGLQQFQMCRVRDTPFFNAIAVRGISTDRKFLATSFTGDTDLWPNDEDTGLQQWILEEPCTGLNSTMCNISLVSKDSSQRTCDPKAEQFTGCDGSSSYPGWNVSFIESNIDYIRNLTTFVYRVEQPLNDPKIDLVVIGWTGKCCVESANYFGQPQLPAYPIWPDRQTCTFGVMYEQPWEPTMVDELYSITYYGILPTFPNASEVSVKGGTQRGFCTYDLPGPDCSSCWGSGGGGGGGGGSGGGGNTRVVQDPDTGMIFVDPIPDPPPLEIPSPTPPHVMRPPTNSPPLPPGKVSIDSYCADPSYFCGKGDGSKVEFCHVPSSGRPQTACVARKSLANRNDGDDGHQDYCGPCVVTPTPPPKTDSDFAVINFDTSGNGTVLTSDDYISKEWFDIYGVTITADVTGRRGGFTPEGKARIFDTKNPGTCLKNGDPDLGSPHKKCPGGGPGTGSQGEPGMPGENCVPQNNVLIIQESNKRWPDDNEGGGALNFEFVKPTRVNWFGFLGTESDRNTMEITTGDGSRKTILIPAMGPGAVQQVAVDTPAVTKVAVNLMSSGAITSFGFSGYSPGKLAPEKPPIRLDTCKVLDFASDSLGNIITSDNYIKDEFYGIWGVTITALASSGGYTPGGRARIFDTNKPGTAADGDPDLGSPNSKCKGGGPGVGLGGEPGMPGQNCKALNNVLIIQEDDKKNPDDNHGGGTLTFDFDSPVAIDTISMIDVEDDKDYVEAVDSDGKKYISFATDMGTNSVQYVPVNVRNVVKLTVYLGGSGAVDSLNICEFTSPKLPPTHPTVALSPGTPIPPPKPPRKIERQKTCALQSVVPLLKNRLEQSAHSFKDIAHAPPNEGTTGCVIHVCPKCTAITKTSWKKHIDATGSCSSITVLTTPLCMTANMANGPRCMDYVNDVTKQIMADYPTIGNTGFDGGPGIDLKVACSSAAIHSRMVNSNKLFCAPDNPDCLLPALGKPPGKKAFLLESPTNKKPTEFFNLVGYGKDIAVIEVPDTDIPALTSSPPPVPDPKTTSGEPAAPVFTDINDPVGPDGFPPNSGKTDPTTLDDAFLTPPKDILLRLHPKLPPHLRGPSPDDPSPRHPAGRRNKSEGVPGPGILEKLAQDKKPFDDHYTPPREEQKGKKPEDVTKQLSTPRKSGVKPRPLPPDRLKKLGKLRDASMKRIKRDIDSRRIKNINDGRTDNPTDRVELFCPDKNEKGDRVTYTVDGSVITVHSSGTSTISDNGGTVTLTTKSIDKKVRAIDRDSNGDPQVSIVDPDTKEVKVFKGKDVSFNHGNGIIDVKGVGAVSFDNATHAAELITAGGTGAVGDRTTQAVYTGEAISTGSGNSPGGSILRTGAGYSISAVEDKDAKFRGYVANADRTYVAKTPHRFPGTRMDQDMIDAPNLVLPNFVGGGHSFNRRLEKFIVSAEQFHFGPNLKQCNDLQDAGVIPDEVVDYIYANESAEVA